MRPELFPEHTDILKKPDSMTEEECADLPVYHNGEVIISCWCATFWERVRFLFTGVMWLWVYSPTTQPPVYLGVDRPFEDPQPGRGEKPTTEKPKDRR